jgi:coproporphyrinogen III oxidase
MTYAVEPVVAYIRTLQERFIEKLCQVDTGLTFVGDPIESPKGISRPRVAEGGNHFDKVAVQFTHSIGQRLPPAATERKPELANTPFQAAAISWIFHPKNPYVPTTHGNLRFFIAGEKESEQCWFGGGFDLTPYYGFESDAVHWHTEARNACMPFGQDIYPKFKRQCDEYFYLPHRKETRGVGGLFFEDWNTGDFEQDFALVRSIGDHFIPAFFPIFERRHTMPYGKREMHHQEVRRGRYVEFNLLYDRGTKYGLQSGRRVESVLASMPAVSRWTYNYTPPAESPESKLQEFLVARDWLS